MRANCSLPDLKHDMSFADDQRWLRGVTKRSKSAGLRVSSVE